MLPLAASELLPSSLELTMELPPLRHFHGQASRYSPLGLVPELGKPQESTSSEMKYITPRRHGAWDDLIVPARHGWHAQPTWNSSFYKPWNRCPLGHCPRLKTEE